MAVLLGKGRSRWDYHRRDVLWSVIGWIHLPVVVFDFCVEHAVLGIITVLFLRCIRLLLDPVNHTRGGIRWPYVAYSTTMFLFVTIYTAVTIHLQSTSFINNRNFPGVDGSSLSGPVGYQIFIYPKPIRVVLDFIFLLNNLLADSLLVSSVSKPCHPRVKYEPHI